MDEEDRYAPQREQMVREQIEQRGIRDARVLSALRTVPRHVFVPADLCAQAYADRALPIGPGQTISQPYIVALMLEELRLQSADRVLEVGTGTGYQTELLSRLVRDVFTLELDPELLKKAEKRLRARAVSNVHCRAGNGFDGWPQHAPYTKIILSAAPQSIPRELVRQLSVNGSLILPFGPEGGQELVLLRKKKEGLKSKELGRVQFVEMKE